MFSVKESFNTSVGRVEVLVDKETRIVSAYRFDTEGRPVAAAIESWEHTDLADLLIHRAGVPAAEANDIAAAVVETWGMRARRLPAAEPVPRTREPREVGHAFGPFAYAGVPRRFVALLLDAVIVLFPLTIVVGLLSGGGYTETGEGYANAGIKVSGSASTLLLALVLGYYVLCEAATGATLGKRMVGIRVVGEDGRGLTFWAAIVRNVLRLVDGFFFYLVGVIFALTSERRQRLGDRAAHTVVVRR
jgi:uncharacterized RDD family membrane protein YckC